ncbi:protein prenylyltransferase [Ophiobolus disseminans]|uniref:Protein prenylyltransferase n=1 Tax=Ophiobolus disseminans TaxID=1469910 RepID=A0A6A7ANF8_9PLEO|nr:protein prenylyltransferase [Ophiobolus disseminans]
MSQKDIRITELQTQAYEVLNSYFQAHEKQIIEIEVLPPAIKPSNGVLMQDGCNLGVPKRILALAFVEARKRFFEDDFQSLKLQATKILLLFDPEHLTAANYRKRWLKDLKADTTPEAQLLYRKSVKYEFCFLDSILTSPLHRQSKSPTLWNHRLWLLCLLMPQDKESVPEDVRADFWRKELSAVFKSGERHPKNYYAWQYARRLEERIDGLDATLDFAQRVKLWCCRHPSDISGWSCLLYLLPKVEPPSERQKLVREVLKYAIDLRSEQESVWVFIRTILAHEALQEWRTGLVSVLQKYAKELESDSEQSTLSALVSRSLDWIGTHGTPVHGSDPMAFV